MIAHQFCPGSGAMNFAWYVLDTIKLLLALALVVLIVLFGCVAVWFLAVAAGGEYGPEAEWIARALITLAVVVAVAYYRWKGRPRYDH
jgi:hypothetical protein